MFAKTEVTYPWLVLAALIVTAFLIRVGVRMAFGEEYFWKNSYFIYYTIAENVASGKGFCLETTCAWLPPLYPLFLALSVVAEKNYLLVIVPQALIGAGTTLCAFLIGRHVFSTRVGILACGMTAFYPYYVMHDTALQETGLVTFLTALSIWLLMRASKLNRNKDWVLAGLALGSAALTRASVAPVIGVALLWCAFLGANGNFFLGLRRSIVLFVAIITMVSPWLIRTYYLVGSPVLSSQVGFALWMGNNPDTFSRYPTQSIDRSRDEAWKKFTEADHAELKRLANDEIATSNWYIKRALVYIRENPWATLHGMAGKLEAAFSWRLNPFREPLAQAAYAVAYAPVVLLGFAGMFTARRRREVILIGMTFLAFSIVSAVYWAHTSHRSYLDVYLIVFAASMVPRIFTRGNWGLMNKRLPSLSGE